MKRTKYIDFSSLTVTVASLQKKLQKTFKTFRENKGKNNKKWLNKSIPTKVELLKNPS